MITNRLSLAGLLLAGPVAASQEQLDHVDLLEPVGDLVGDVFAVSAYPDRDGDQVPDVAYFVGDAYPDEGVLRISSSSSGRVLHSVPIEIDGAFSDFVHVDDLDGDAWPDLLVLDGQRYVGYSVRTGKRLWTTDLYWEFSGNNPAACSIRDATGDGVPDIVVGAIYHTWQTPLGEIFEGGAAYVFSGASGALLEIRTFAASTLSFGDRWGKCLANLGDLDGDGFDAVAIGSETAKAAIFEPLTPGGAFQYIGPGSQVNDPANYETRRITGFGGSNGDHPYVAVADFFDQPGGNVVIYSATTGAELAHLIHPYYSPVLLEQWGFGVRVDGVGDLDGDGHDDLLVSCYPDAGDPEWIAYSGAPGFAKIGQDWTSATITGLRVADAGDVDGDGLDEFWMRSSTSSGAADVGPSWLRLRGLTGSFPEYQLALDGSDGVGLGSAVAVLDDLDGDGRAELAVGAPNHASGAGVAAGRVTVLDADGQVLYTLDGQPLEQFGAAIAALDDLDGDGTGDFAVGHPWSQSGQTRRGRVTVYSGATGQVLRSHGGPVTGSMHGSAIARIPDVNSDGVDEYAIGAPNYDSGGWAVGRVALYSGASGAFLWDAKGTLNDSRLGASIAGADLDGDGRGEVLAGAPGAWSSIAAYAAGQVWRFEGATGVVESVVGGSNPLEGFGTRVVGLGDVDGDDIDDWAASAPLYNGSDVDDGRVVVRSGATGAVVRTHVGLFGEQLGAGLAAVGDQDNDGRADYAIGSPYWLSFFTFQTRGQVLVISGRTGATIESLLSSPLTGPFENDGFGTVLAAGGDRDGGGLGDLAIGRPVAGDKTSDFGSDAFLAVGEVDCWSLRALGTEHFGAGTAGCAGPNVLQVLEPAAPGDDLLVRLSALEPGTFSVFWVATNSNPTGVVLPGTGALLHLDVLTIVLSLTSPPAAAEFSDRVIAIPDKPALSGLALHLQEFVLWPLGCPSLPLYISSSNGVTVVLQ